MQMEFAGAWSSVSPARKSPPTRKSPAAVEPASLLRPEAQLIPAGAAPPATELPPATADVARAPAVLPTDAERETPARPPFGAWLLRQRERAGFIGTLAQAAVADRGFPKGGDVDAVHGRLLTMGADGDMFEALDDAERAWLAA